VLLIGPGGTDGVLLSASSMASSIAACGVRIRICASSRSTTSPVLDEHFELVFGAMLVACEHGHDPSAGSHQQALTPALAASISATISQVSLVEVWPFTGPVEARDIDRDLRCSFDKAETNAADCKRPVPALPPA